MVFRHISAALCEMFYTIPIMSDWYRRTYCMDFTYSRFESSGFLSVWQPKTPCVCSYRWKPSLYGGSPYYLQLPLHLWMDAAVHDELCRGEHWMSWRKFWAFIINVLLAITHKNLNVSGHIFIWTYFLVLSVWNLCPKFVCTVELYPA
jgi:hypothetical protein